MGRCQPSSQKRLVHDVDAVDVKGRRHRCPIVAPQDLAVRGYRTNTRQRLGQGNADVLLRKRPGPGVVVEDRIAAGDGFQPSRFLRRLWQRSVPLQSGDDSVDLGRLEPVFLHLKQVASSFSPCPMLSV
jgi:hypothetical protein